jgi:hypothetical protein
MPGAGRAVVRLRDFANYRRGVSSMFKTGRYDFVRGVVSILMASVFAAEVSAQLVWDQEMKEYSAILPLTLENNVYRVRAKPPEGVRPRDIICNIGITGTVLTDQRGTSASDPGEKVLDDLRNYDDIDVQFADRVFTGNRDYVGNRIIRNYDFDCGINIKYQTKAKVAQVEIRVGYVLPSGDIEGLTWNKIRRKEKIFENNLTKCNRYRNDIDYLNRQCESLASSGSNSVERMVISRQIAGLERKIAVKQRFISKEDEFRRDLAAFRSINEYLKTKIHGCQVYVHFQYDGETLPVDLDELKRARVRPIQVFEIAKDPIVARQEP